MMNLVWWILVGLIAGWAAGKIMKGHGYGTLMNIVLGMVGAVIGGWVFGLLGLHADSLVGPIIVAIVGAILLIWVAGKLKK